MGIGFDCGSERSEARAYFLAVYFVEWPMVITYLMAIATLFQFLSFVLFSVGFGESAVFSDPDNLLYQQRGGKANRVALIALWLWFLSGTADRCRVFCWALDECYRGPQCAPERG